MQTKLLSESRGDVAAVISSLIVGIVMMFVGLFMINAVSSAIALNNSSSFWTVYSTLITLVGTVFSVLGLVIIVVALAFAISYLRGMTSA